MTIVPATAAVGSKTIPRDRARERARQDEGFTLLEVLLVMLIVSIAAGVVVLAIPSTLGKGADLQREAERVAALLQMAGDEAVVEGREFGFEAREKEYMFYRYDDERARWVAVSEQPFQQRDLPEGLRLELDVEGRPLGLGEGTGAPSVLLLSSGETTPFHLYIREERGAKREITSDGFSGIALLDAEG